MSQQQGDQKGEADDIHDRGELLQLSSQHWSVEFVFGAVWKQSAFEMVACSHHSQTAKVFAWSCADPNSEYNCCTLVAIFGTIHQTIV
jgi:hypothetical protein